MSIIEESSTSTIAVPLFKDRVTVLSTAIGADGLVWSFCAKFDRYAERENVSAGLTRSDFKYEFFILCQKTNFRMAVRDPLNRFRYRDLILFGKCDAPVASRTLCLHLDEDEDEIPNEVLMAGADELLMQLCVNAEYALDCWAVRRARRLLTSGKTDPILPYRKQLNALRATEVGYRGIPNVKVRQNALAWVNLRLKILVYPDQHIREVALQMLNLEKGSLTFVKAPKPEEIIDAVKLAFS